jgi:hypothetical protein
MDPKRRVLEQKGREVERAATMFFEAMVGEPSSLLERLAGQSDDGVIEGEILDEEEGR